MSSGRLLGLRVLGNAIFRHHVFDQVAVRLRQPLVWAKRIASSIWASFFFRSTSPVTAARIVAIHSRPRSSPNLATFFLRSSGLTRAVQLSRADVRSVIR